MTSSTSSKPSRQRAALYQTHAARRHTLLSASLSTELKTSQGRNSYPVRKGDTVKIMRGDFAGIEGKITKIDTKRQRLFIEGVSREKVAGTSTNVSVHSSKVTITKLNLDDKWRADSIRILTATKNSQEGA